MENPSEKEIVSRWRREAAVQEDDTGTAPPPQKRARRAIEGPASSTAATATADGGVRSTTAARRRTRGAKKKVLLCTGVRRARPSRAIDDDQDLGPDVEDKRVVVERSETERVGTATTAGAGRSRDERDRQGVSRASKFILDMFGPD